MCSQAIAIFTGKVKGYVVFHQCSGENSVTVDFHLHGMHPNKQHAIHIHEYGDLSDGCASLGPHWNPTSQTHGSILFREMPRHAGDLINNLKTDSFGRFNFTYSDNLLRLRGKKSIVGRSVVIHSGIDDLGLGGDKESLITGNAGGRMDCAVIGWSKCR